MKCIILLTFVALCYSLPYRFTGERSVNINEDGTIVITGTSGKKVTITKGFGPFGQKNIEITISGPNIPTKKIQINEQNELKNVNLLVDRNKQEGEFDISDEYQRDKRSSKDYKRRFQGDTLADILKEYQGVVDDKSYEQLLKKVDKAVRSGQLSESVYDVLQSLSQSQNVIGQSQGGWDISRQQNQGILGGQANLLDLLQTQQQLEELLQQQQWQQRQQQQEWQGGKYGVPVSMFDQQVLSPFGQRIGNPIDAQGRIIGTTAQGVILEVPVETQQGRIVERVLLEQPQAMPYPDVRGLATGSRIDASNFRGAGKLRGRMPMTWEDLLNSYGTQNLQQRGGPLTQYGQQTQLSQVIENEREILDQQRRIQEQQLQQQQLQQQERQQILQRQLQQQQQQQQQQQLLQQLQQQQQRQQQQQQDQERQQQQLRQQVQQQQQQQQELQQEVQQQQYQLQQVEQQRNTLKEYLLNYRPLQDRVRQGEFSQQQLGVYPPGVLGGGIGEQRIPMTQAYRAPLVI